MLKVTFSIEGPAGRREVVSDPLPHEAMVDLYRWAKHPTEMDTDDAGIFVARVRGILDGTKELREAGDD